MRRLLIIILSFILCCNLYSQQVYVTNSTGSIFELNGGAGSCTNILLPNECLSTSGNSAFSLAFYNDTVYFNSPGQLYSFKIGVPGSCHSYGAVSSANSMTVDKNGILYFVNGVELVSYNPYTNQKTIHGNLPFSSAGDLIFFNGILLLAGSPAGIYEVNISNPPSSTLYMNTNGRSFWGLISYPVPCGNSRYYGLEPLGSGTNMVELDLVNKIILNNACTVAFQVYDGASSTETGLNAGINITNFAITQPCPPANTGSVNISAAAGLSAITYTLDNTITNTSGFFTNIPLGNHSIHIQAAGGCALDTPFVIAQGLGQNIAIQKNNVTNCNNNNGSISINALSAHNPIKYSLNGGPLAANPIFTGLSSGIYNIHIEDAVGCFKDTTAQLIYAPQPFFNTLIKEQEHCGLSNGSIQIKITEDSANAESSINNGLFNPWLTYYNLSAGTYYIQVRKGINCYFDTTISINNIMDVKPAISLQVKNQVCYINNGAISFSIIGSDAPYQFQLNGMGYFSQTKTDTLSPGFYLINIKNKNSCMWDSFATILPYAKTTPLVQLQVQQPTCRKITDGKITISISGAQSPYSFSLNNLSYSSGQTVSGLTETDYKIYIQNKDGCMVDSLIQTLKIPYNPNCNEVYIPTAFSPNNDGVNDIYKPSSSFFIKNLSLNIYNRFGQLLYKGIGQNALWDGAYKNVPQDSGNYIYLLTYTNYFGEYKVQKGSFILIR